MEAIELIEKTVENKKFRVHIRGLVKDDFDIWNTAEMDGKYLKIIPCSESILQYGFLRGIENDMINILRSEFPKIGYKEKYNSDQWIKDEFTKRLKKEPAFKIYLNEIRDVKISHRKGKLYKVCIETEGGAIVEFIEIKCTNLEKSEKAIDKFKV